jgi:transposase
MPPADTIHLTPEQRTRLEKAVRARTSPQRLVHRAQMILLADDGCANSEIARRLGANRSAVIKWKRRFLERGFEGIAQDLPRPAAPSQRLAPEKVKAVVEATLHSTPPKGTHWSSRSMAQSQGISVSSVQRIWRAHHLRPHRSGTFKLSLDERFVEKLVDVVGLYVDPPEKALVLCVDEKSQIQALERTQPILPLREGLPEQRTHDYERHGTTTLFAALNVLDGEVTGACYERHTHEEFLAFLQHLSRLPRIKRGKRQVHLIVDNYATHKHPAVKSWLEKHPRFQLHFTPTSCSWVNMIETWFSALTTQRIRRGSFRSVPELIRAIEGYIEQHNATARPYVWTASVESIVRKINRVYSSS